MSEIQLDKRQLRHMLRARRRAVTLRQRHRAALRLAQFAARQAWFRRAKSIALYFAADGEIDPKFLLERALALGKRVYVPQLCAGNRLVFGEYVHGAALQRNRFGIAEPKGRASVAPEKLDLVLLPLVAFDRRGGRLGMGGGFYDRSFAGSGRRQRQLIGLAYRFQEVAALPREPWDVPLAGIATDRGWIKARR